MNLNLKIKEVFSNFMEIESYEVLDVTENYLVELNVKLLSLYTHLISSFKEIYNSSKIKKKNLFRCSVDRFWLLLRETCQKNNYPLVGTDGILFKNLLSKFIIEKKLKVICLTHPTRAKELILVDSVF